MPFYRISEMEEQRASVSPATARTVPGELMKVGVVTYLEGEGATPHFHPNEEQFILVLEGRRCVIVGEEERIVEPGDLVHIPRNTRHGGRTLSEKAVFFVAKSPCGDGDLAQDYNEAEDAASIAARLERRFAQVRQAQEKGA